MARAAIWEGRRSDVSSVKTVSRELPQPARGGQFASPTAVTPGIERIDSIMRFCIAGTASAEEPAISKSVSARITFPGRKPKSLSSERTNPRTATSEGVTNRAQMAICTATNASRKVIGRPNLATEPDFTISYGSVASTCLTGTAPKRMPLTNASSAAKAYTFASGFSGTFVGNCGKGFHATSLRRSSAPPRIPRAPPRAKSPEPR